MLELSSNTIKVLGIFGRLSSELEERFDDLESKYSTKPSGDEFDIIRHLTLTFIEDASVTDIKQQLDLLQSLKQFLPLTITIKNITVKDEESHAGSQHIAFEFDDSETEELTRFISKTIGEEKTVKTWYIKSIWFVPKENQQTVIDQLSDLKTLTFTDFYLVSNKQDEANTIYTTQKFIESNNYARES